MTHIRARASHFFRRLSAVSPGQRPRARSARITARSAVPHPRKVLPPPPPGRAALHTITIENEARALNFQIIAGDFHFSNELSARPLSPAVFACPCASTRELRAAPVRSSREIAGDERRREGSRCEQAGRVLLPGGSRGAPIRAERAQWR